MKDPAALPPQERGLAGYLLLPRLGTWAKGQMAPAYFLLAASGPKY